MRWTAILLLLIVSSCANRTAPQARSNPTTLPIPSWPADISTEQARSLTLDECKAILVAKAAIEASAGAAIHAHFKVEKDRDDWIVTAFYTPPTGYVTPPGYFTSVRISRDWSVKRIIGGA